MLNDLTVNNQTIIIENIIVGSIGKFERENTVEITYLIDKNLWGQGIATAALKQFLNIETSRPIIGRVVFDNFGSQKVLEKCGFIKIGTGIYFSNSQQIDTQEIIYELT